MGTSFLTLALFKAAKMRVIYQMAPITAYLSNLMIFPCFVLHSLRTTSILKGSPSTSKVQSTWLLHTPSSRWRKRYLMSLANFISISMQSMTNRRGSHLMFSRPTSWTTKNYLTLLNRKSIKWMMNPTLIS